MYGKHYCITYNKISLKIKIIITFSNTMHKKYCNKREKAKLENAHILQKYLSPVLVASRRYQEFSGLPHALEEAKTGNNNVRLCKEHCLHTIHVKITIQRQYYYNINKKVTVLGF